MVKLAASYVFHLLQLCERVTSDQRAESLAVASRSSLGLVAPSSAHAADLLALLPEVMAPQALAFSSPAESCPLSTRPAG